MTTTRQGPEPGDVLEAELLVIDMNTYVVLDHLAGIKQGDGRMIAIMDGGVEIKASRGLGGLTAIEFAPKLARALKRRRTGLSLTGSSGD